MTIAEILEQSTLLNAAPAEHQKKEGAQHE
jgi:hypothetical protein